MRCTTFALRLVRAPRLPMPLEATEEPSASAESSALI